MKIKAAFVCAYNLEHGLWLGQKRSQYIGNPLLWNFPGGGIEEGEDWRLAAQREFFEEVGVLPPLEELEFQGVVGTKPRKALFLWHCHELFEGASGTKECEKHKWFPIGKFPRKHAPWMAAMCEGAIHGISS